MEHTEDASLGLWDDEAGEAAEGVAPGASGIHQRRDARVHARQVGVHARLVDALVDVAVQVYESGNHQLAGNVHDPRLRAGSDVWGHLGN